MPVPATPHERLGPARALSPSERRTERLLAATHLVEQRHFWFRGLRQFVRPLVASAAAGLHHPRLLDCGCGTGANLTMLNEFGRSFGFDLSSVGPRFARGYGQTRLAQASITQIPYPDQCFDVVTAIDVLYTLEEDDERAAVAETFRVLRPGGVLIVNVAALSLLRGTHATRGNEIRRSSRRRLRRVLRHAGYTVERLTYTNFSLFPIILIVRLAQRLLRRATPEETGIEMQMPPALINEPLAALLAVEASLLRVADMPIGSSLLCVARRGR